MTFPGMLSRCSDLTSALTAKGALVTTEHRVTRAELRGEGHMRWFPGWRLRTANKIQPRVTDLDIIKTADEEMLGNGLIDLPNCKHDTSVF